LLDGRGDRARTNADASSLVTADAAIHAGDQGFAVGRLGQAVLVEAVCRPETTITALVRDAINVINPKAITCVIAERTGNNIVFSRYVHDESPALYVRYVSPSHGLAFVANLHGFERARESFVKVGVQRSHHYSSVRECHPTELFLVASLSDAVSARIGEPVGIQCARDD
jgi:hypothetical protein